MTREPLEQGVSVDPGAVAKAGLLRSGTGASGRGVRATVLIGVTGLALAWPFLSDFTVSLFATIALYAIVTAGLVLMTGVAGMTSFGQAAFVGLGSYATAWICTSPVMMARL